MQKSSIFDKITKWSVTFEPLDGFSNFKSLNDLEFCQESFKLTAEVVLAKTKEIGVMKNSKVKLH